MSLPYLILVAVLAYAFRHELRSLLLELELWARQAEEVLCDLWALVLALATVAAALPAEAWARLRRR